MVIIGKETSIKLKLIFSMSDRLGILEVFLTFLFLKFLCWYINIIENIEDIKSVV